MPKRPFFASKTPPFLDLFLVPKKRVKIIPFFTPIKTTFLTKITIKYKINKNHTFYQKINIYPNNIENTQK